MKENNKSKSEFKLHKSSRGIWIYVDGKHLKTIPAIYESMILDHIDQLSFKSKYLSKIEIDIFKMQIFNDALKVFFDTLKDKEPNVYRVIANAKCIGVRIVQTRYSNNRYELCFDNNLKVKCNYKLFSLHPVELPIAFLNY